MLIGSAVGLGLSGMMRGMNRVDSAGATIAQNGIGQVTEGTRFSSVVTKQVRVSVSRLSHSLQAVDNFHAGSFHGLHLL